MPETPEKMGVSEIVGIQHTLASVGIEWGTQDCTISPVRYLVVADRCILI